MKRARDLGDENECRCDCGHDVEPHSPGVEGSRTLLTKDAGETAGETVGERRLGDESDTGRLEGAERNVGEELGDGRGTEVDGLTVLSGLVNAEDVDSLLLPELVTSELEGTLDGVTDDGGAETGEKRAGSLGTDDLSESSDHALQTG
jgi:hypothetical protein